MKIYEYQAHETASRILSSPLKGEPVREVLIQEALQVKEVGRYFFRI